MKFKKYFQKLFVFSITVLFVIRPANADILTLKNGKVLENVKTISITKISIEISIDGKKSNYPKSIIKSLRLKPVVETTVTGEKDKTGYEKEKIRIAESLGQTTDWEIDSSRKLKIAVLSFKAGSGVSEGEVETIAELVTNSLVRTKLFIVVDKITVEKAIKDNLANCDSNECNNTSLSSYLNTSKIITGSVTKIGKRYFINGNIVDSQKNQIDFGETAEAENSNKFSEAADYFAKKAAGGISDYADIGISNSDKDSPSLAANKNLPHLARSAVLPGWGQWKKADKMKGSILFTSTILSLGFLLKANNDFTQNKDAYTKANSIGYLSFVSPGTGIGALSYLQTMQAKSALETNANQIKSASFLLLGIYLYNLVDAYFTSDKAKAAESIKTGFIFNMQNQSSKATTTAQSEANYTIGYQWRF